VWSFLSSNRDHGTLMMYRHMLQPQGHRVRLACLLLPRIWGSRSLMHEYSLTPQAVVRARPCLAGTRLSARKAVAGDSHITSVVCPTPSVRPGIVCMGIESYKIPGSVSRVHALDRGPARQWDGTRLMMKPRSAAREPGVPLREAGRQDPVPASALAQGPRAPRNDRFVPTHAPAIVKFTMKML
jgi:hypothetical protein